MRNDGLASSHDLPPDLSCGADFASLRPGRSPVAVITLAIVAYLVVAGVLYATLRWSEARPGEATTITLLSEATGRSDSPSKCAAPTTVVRSERGLVPVASQEAPDDVLQRRAAEGSATRFDEDCRPLPSAEAESRSQMPVAAADAPKPAVAPTPAPPDLARAQPQRFVLMVEVEAQHDPGVRP